MDSNKISLEKYELKAIETALRLSIRAMSSRSGETSIDRALLRAEKIVAKALESSQEFNHNRTLESFQEQLDIIIAAGFNPIGVSQLYLEDTFIFGTAEEALAAYEALEKYDGLETVEEKLQVWWYGKENFLKEVEDYEKEFESKVLYYFF
jgi:hypothetical protein